MPVVGGRRRRRRRPAGRAQRPPGVGRRSTPATTGPARTAGPIPATVEQVAYLGGNVQYLVRIGGRAVDHRPRAEDRDAAPGRRRRRCHLVARRRARPRRASRCAGGDPGMNDRHRPARRIDARMPISSSPSTATLAARRISRRQLLETAARVGPARGARPDPRRLRRAATPQPSVAPPSVAAPTTAPSAASAARRPPRPRRRPCPRPRPSSTSTTGTPTSARRRSRSSRRRPGSRSTTTSSPTPRRCSPRSAATARARGYDICYPTSVDVPALVTDGVIQPLEPRPDPERDEPRRRSGRTRATTRATRTRCRTCGGRPASAGTATRSRTT